LQDFTTGSWTAFARMRGSSGSTPRAMTRQAPSLPVVGDAKLGLKALGEAMGGYKAPSRPGPTARKPSAAKWDAYVADNVAQTDGNRPNSYAQAIGVVNALCDRATGW
jgi:3D-(3,5/4)-trihydroxycyclohexane-1,2-dione acylhydrolase (decyclizing)